MKMSFYTPEITNVPAGKPVMDRMVQQNHLPGRYVIHSFQEVKSVDRTGANQRGWYYHVGITEDMKDKLLQRNYSVCVLLQQISVSIAGKRTAQSDAEPSRAKCRKEAQKSKKHEVSKRAEDLPQPQLTGGEDPADVAPPPATPSVSGGGKKMEALKEGTMAVVGEALKEGTQTTNPGRPETPTPTGVGKVKLESESDPPHLLTGEEYRHYQLLKRQEANRLQKQSVGTCPGPEKPAKHGPGRPRGSRSKGWGSGAGRGGNADASIQKYLSQ